jgi:hypothetical protein
MDALKKLDLSKATLDDLSPFAQALLKKITESGLVDTTIQNDIVARTSAKKAEQQEEYRRNPVGVMQRLQKERVKANQTSTRVRSGRFPNPSARDQENAKARQRMRDLESSINRERYPNFY